MPLLASFYTYYTSNSNCLVKKPILYHVSMKFMSHRYAIVFAIAFDVFNAGLMSHGSGNPALCDIKNVSRLSQFVRIARENHARRYKMAFNNTILNLSFLYFLLPGHYLWNRWRLKRKWWG